MTYNVKQDIADVAIQTETKERDPPSRLDEFVRRMRACHNDMAVWITSGAGLCRLLPMSEIRDPRLEGPESAMVQSDPLLGPGNLASDDHFRDYWRCNLRCIWDSEMIGIFEHIADNRSGKTFLMAFFAWLAWLAGRIVLCNCEKDLTKRGGYDCILNFPHLHYHPRDLFRMRLFNTYIMTDQAEQFFDARLSQKEEIRRIGYWEKQVMKNNCEFHFDTTRHKDIEFRIRFNPTFLIRTERIPKDPEAPLQAIRILTQSRYAKPNEYVEGYFIEPLVFKGIYNHLAGIHRQEVIA
jgi:hypothetical protein